MYFEGDPEARWYAMYVRSRHEKVAEKYLTGRGFCAFSPFYSTRRKWSDRTKEIDVPLFPGYVFCQFDANKRLPILTTPGLVRLVGGGNVPEPIDDLEIHSIQLVVESGRPVQPWPFLKVGQRIRVQAGPLAGAEGTLLQVKNHMRLVASLALLQRSVAVDIDQDSVVPVF